jgi:hypothetical protein
MLGIGSGFLKQMAETMKANREMLKIARKGHFNKRENYLSPRNQGGLVDENYDPEAILLIRASAINSAQRESRRQFVVLGISVAITAVLVVIALKVLNSLAH